MPINNVTATKPGKMSLQEIVIKILVLTLAASRLNSKVYFFHLGCIFASHWSHTKLKIEWL